MTNTIPCQPCKPEDESCYRCGGHKQILLKYECDCGQEYWIPPGNGKFTAYFGKKFQSFDGLKITCYADKPWTCARCE